MNPPPYWLLGLPFDCISEAEAAARLLEAIRERRRLTFATPNVNFVTMATQDPAFANSILQTDLSLVDGMPLVWLGRACGIPFPERVAGSSLFERLQTSNSPHRIRVFFFGGEDGAAQESCERLSQAGGSLEPAGGLSPGFRSVEAMSDEGTLNAINAARPDFLVVALGAKKGHEWIARNRSRLEAPVVSHLGAVVNFVAGRLKRAPRPMQRLGLEWLWRTITEPRLATRYAADAARLARDVPSLIAPASWEHHARRRKSPPLLEIIERQGPNLCELQLRGSFNSGDVQRFMSVVESNLRTAHARVLVDVSSIHAIDSHAMGALYAVRWRVAGSRVSVSGRRGTPIHEVLLRQRGAQLVEWHDDLR